MYKRTVVSVMVLVVLFSVYSTFAQEMKAVGGRHHKQMMKAKMDKTQAQVDEFTTELNLKPEQGAKIKEILTRSHNEAKAILEEAKAKVKEIKIKAHEEIKALLTEAQKKKFQEIRKKHEAAPEIKE